jgi:hypothetical protein
MQHGNGKLYQATVLDRFWRTEQARFPLSPRGIAANWLLFANSKVDGTCTMQVIRSRTLRVLRKGLNVEGKLVAISLPGLQGELGSP